MRYLLRALKTVAIWAVALIVLFEEWGWEPLARLLGKLARLPFIGWVERRIAQLPPYAALAIFLLPGLALLPIKLLALWLITQGRGFLGLMVIIAAKLAGTAIVARLFMLTRPALMRLAWFARWYEKWDAWKNKAIALVRASAAWQRAVQAKATVLSTLKAARSKLKAWLDKISSAS